jgi:DNA-binding GntR family transcriptional regulator
MPKPAGFRRSLHEELTGRLRDMILRHHLLPGQWVPEAELCEDLGVSRTPLREALKALAAEKLVTLYPYRGVAVAEFSREHVAHVFEVQCMLESKAAELACERAAVDEIDEFEKTHKRMVRLFERGDRKAYFALNQELHRALVAMSHNPVLVETHAGVLVQVERARFLALDIGRRWEDSVSQHDAILLALQARDGDTIRAIVRRHIEETRLAVEAAIEARFGLEPPSPSRPPKSRNVRRRKVAAP